MLHVCCSECLFLGVMPVCGIQSRLSVGCGSWDKCRCKDNYSQVNMWLTDLLAMLLSFPLLFARLNLVWFCISALVDEYARCLQGQWHTDFLQSTTCIIYPRAKSPSSQNGVFFLCDPTVESLSFTVLNDMCRAVPIHY